LYELSIIKTFLTYQEWYRWKEKLSVKDLPKELQPVYSVLNNFHESNTEQINLTVSDLANLLFAHKHKDVEYYEGVIKNLENVEVSNTTTAILLQSFVDNKLLKEISLAAYEVTEGTLPKHKLSQLLEQYTAEKDNKVSEEEFEFISDDIEELLTETFRKPGLRWRLNTLNQILGSLRGGDFGFIFARPETGKTTFLASETTFMAEQLGEDDGPIIWFNNEEKGSKVKIRCYQASLGAELAAINSNTTTAKAAYLKRTKGKHLLLNPKGTINKSMVEQVCRRYKPSLIIFDQIDKITGFEADREDLKLGSMYQWARELAKELDCPVIAVCQADGTGEGAKWLTMGNVANAKTAKQAEADWIVGIGKIPDTGYENVRYLHASKNKLSGDEDSLPDQRHGKREVLIRPSIARYEDIM
jgi:replicative DNA helicase